MAEGGTEKKKESNPQADAFNWGKKFHRDHVLLTLASCLISIAHNNNRSTCEEGDGCPARMERDVGRVLQA